MADWTPSDEFRNRATLVITRARENALRDERRVVGDGAERLSAQGLGRSGAMINLHEQAAQAALHAFVRGSLEGLLSLLRQTYGTVPAASASWVGETLKSHVASMCTGIENRLRERRDRDHVPSTAVAAMVGMARVHAERDIDIELAPFAIRVADGIADQEVRGVSSKTIYNVTGTNARVNISSTDSSTNIVNVDARQLFADMRAAAEQAEIEADDRAVLVAKVDAMEKANGTKTFAAKYADFMATAANHVAVFQPFLPALVQLITAAVS